MPAAKTGIRRPPERCIGRPGVLLVVALMTTVLGSACTLGREAESGTPTYEETMSSLLDAYAEEIIVLNSLMGTVNLSDPIWQSQVSDTANVLLAISRNIEALEAPSCFVSTQQQLELGLTAADRSLESLINATSIRDLIVLSRAVKSLNSTIPAINAAIVELTRITCPL